MVSRRQFIKIGAAVVGGAAAASVVEIPFLGNSAAQKDSQINDLEGKLASAQQQVSTLQTQVGTTVGFLTLNLKEQVIVEAIAEAMIPSDTATGPGAKEAGVVYFIDRMLNGAYGSGARMYMQGPFLLPNQSDPITVGGITYAKGTPTFPYDQGFGFQYGITFRDFWRIGLQALTDYSSSAYKTDFEKLSAEQQLQVIQDLFGNKPSNFVGISPSDFIHEVHRMVFAGFLSDPLYGGNKGMVGWTLLGYNGLNQGNFFGEGMTTKQLMVMNTPVRLKPASLALLQNQGK